MEDDRNPNLMGDAVTRFSCVIKDVGEVIIASGSDETILVEIKYMKAGVRHWVWEFLTFEELADAILSHRHSVTR